MYKERSYMYYNNYRLGTLNIDNSIATITQGKWKTFHTIAKIISIYTSDLA
jgi:hypothetical protein